MDVFVEPTEEERDFYYHGLPSSPKLVARSSTEPWVLRRDDWNMPIVKTLRPVGTHPILDKWNDDTPGSLRDRVVALLSARGLDWHAIDVLRIGYEDNPDAPVVVFVSVEPGSLSGRIGRDVAAQARLLLVHYELRDVDCEIKESRLFSHAAPRISQLLSNVETETFSEEESLICDCVGNVISPQDRPTLQGTNCLYLQDPSTHVTYALTCRHVCFGPESLEATVQRLPSTVSTNSSVSLQPRMIQLGNDTLNATLESLESMKREGQQMISECEERAAWADRDRFMSLAEGWHSKLRSMTPVLAKLKDRMDPSTRVFGKVAYFREHGIRSHGELSDWALIRLEPSRYDRPLSQLENRVFVGANLGVHPFLVDRKPDANGTLRLEGVVDPTTLSCHDNISSQSFATKLVCKRGGTSGLTFGRYNQAKSVLRKIYNGPNSPTFTALEFCVIAYPPKRGIAFSTKGDSGACVWDTRRRIMGMITSGIGRVEVLQSGDWDELEPPMDVTYMTPMEWVLEDMAAMRP